MVNIHSNVKIVMDVVYVFMENEKYCVKIATVLAIVYMDDINAIV
jgi:hypothetical protein